MGVGTRESRREGERRNSESERAGPPANSCEARAEQQKKPLARRRPGGPPQVVTPIFGFLAVQVDKMGTSGRESAHRVTYDDCNESLCAKEVVHKVGGAGLEGAGGQHVCIAHCMFGVWSL